MAATAPTSDSGSVVALLASQAPRSGTRIAKHKTRLGLKIRLPPAAMCPALPQEADKSHESSCSEAPTEATLPRLAIKLIGRFVSTQSLRPLPGNRYSLPGLYKPRTTLRTVYRASTPMASVSYSSIRFGTLGAYSGD